MKMMKKAKRVIPFVATATVITLVAGTVSYAAPNSNYTMQYLPGTEDTVSNLPENDAGTGGEAYTVSSEKPEREGFEFLSWILKWGTKEIEPETFTLTYQVIGDSQYGKPGDVTEPETVTDIPEGSEVVLAEPLTTDWETADGTAPDEVLENYKVNYLEVGTDRVLAPQKVVEDKTVGETVTEEAISIDGYTVVGEDSQDLTIEHKKTGEWSFTGWCSDSACEQPISEVAEIGADTTVYGKWKYTETDNANNEITFYYKKSAISWVSYTVCYIDLDTGEKIAPDVVREMGVPGSVITEHCIDVEDFVCINSTITFECSEDIVIEFFYYQIG